MAPKRAKELAPLTVKRITEPGRYAVGGVRGLYLNVTDTGARSWVLRYVLGVKQSDNGKTYVQRREAGLGPYPEVGVGEARTKAAAWREALEAGRDPLAERNAARDELRAAHARAMTFEQAARLAHKVKAKTFRSAKHGSDWIKSVERYALPVIGSMPVDQVGVPDMVRILEPIWSDKQETASRLRQRLEAILAWATAGGHRSGDNPARWPENLDHLLGKVQKNVRHHSALRWQQVGRFMVDLRQRDGEGARALEFVILTAARSGEVRGMLWSEIDLDARTWTVPASRIKAGRMHTVPLSDAAAALLEAKPHREGLVFRAPRGGQLSDMALLGVCRRMSVDAVPHGFRSTFKDWARSCTRYADEVSELQLAHVNSDATRAAYARDQLLPKRAKMMADWAKFLSRPMAAGEVVGIGKRA